MTLPTPNMTDSAPSFRREQVVEIVNSVIHRMSVHRPVDDNLILELHALKDSIDMLKQELNSAHPVGIQSHIPSASDELGAIVEMTENATNTIMEACEVIQVLLQKHPYAEGMALETEIIRIVEACTFQDITGQRISKIMKALSAIDTRATELANILESSFADAATPSTPAASAEVSLMNGPQLPGQGMSQEDIDRMLNDLF